MPIDPNETILVVAAHPDDEVLGCGGMIGQAAKRGIDVHVAILGEGATSRHAMQDGLEGTAEVKKLQNQAREVARLLGTVETVFVGLPDNRFDTVPLLDIVKRIEDLVIKIRPSVVFTHHAGDLNVDHSIVHRAVLTAARPMPGQPVDEIYAFEVPSSTDWAFGQFGGPFHPNVFWDVQASLDAKIRALELYRSEIRSFPHPRSEELLRVNARRWGSLVGLEAAEAFELIWKRIV